MSNPRSFRPSDSSLRDFPGFVAVYLIISLFSIGLGLFLESLPEFWSGVLLGGGVVLLALFFLLSPAKQEVDTAAIPEPSERVRAKCEDPSCSLVEAVKVYREETGLGLAEAKAAVESYKAKMNLGEHGKND